MNALNSDLWFSSLLEPFKRANHFCRGATAFISYPRQVNYRCKEGFYLDGRPHNHRDEPKNTAFACVRMASGAFSVLSDPCVPVSCGLPPAAASAFCSVCKVSLSVAARWFIRVTVDTPSMVTPRLRVARMAPGFLCLQRGSVFEVGWCLARRGWRPGPHQPLRGWTTAVGRCSREREIPNQKYLAKSLCVAWLWWCLRKPRR